MKKFDMAHNSLSKENFELLCTKWLGKTTHSKKVLLKDLRRDLRLRIQHAKEMFDYATEESHFKGDDAFKWSEFWDWAYEVESFDWKDPDHNNKVKAFLEKHYAAFKPKLRLAILDELSQSIDDMNYDMSEAQIITTYWRVDDIFKPMEEFIFALVRSYEEHVQLQIDIARGK